MSQKSLAGIGGFFVFGELMAEGVIETPAAPDAPPPAEPSWGSALMDFGLNDEATVETPLPGAAEGAAAEPPKQAVAEGEKADPTVEEGEKPKQEATPEVKNETVDAKPEDESVIAKPQVEDDPELSPEDNELVRTRPALEQPELKGRLKKASFFNQYSDPTVAGEGTRTALEKISPSGYAKLEGAVITRKLADPAAFADEVFKSNPELYGKLALEVYNSDPAYFTKQITGKADVSPETVKTALDFYERNKDRAVDGPAGEELAPELVAEMRLLLGDEVADKIIAATKRSQPAAAAVDPEKEALRAKVEEFEKAKSAEQTKEQREAEAAKQQAAAEAQKAIRLEQDQTWEVASGQIETYLETFADDAKDGLGLKVTPQERELAPEVADLKDFKRSVLFDGIGDLPDFRKGLVEWGKTLPPAKAEVFQKKLNLAYHFADQREKDNAIAAAQALIPFVEQYKQERLKAPIFARIDNLIRIAAAGANPKTENETIIPGAPKASSQPSSDPQARIVDLLLDAAMKP